MDKVNITGITGKVPMDCLSGVEFTDIFDGLDVLARTVEATAIVAKYNINGTISIEVTDKDGNFSAAYMEA